MPHSKSPASREADYAPVELALAEHPLDLWPVLEAARFARIVNRDAPPRSAEERAIRTFIAMFSHLAESWEEVPVACRVPALKGIEGYLERMRENGIYLHAGAIECAFSEDGAEARSFPIAVLNLGPDRLPTLTLMIPHAIAVDGR